MAVSLHGHTAALKALVKRMAEGRDAITGSKSNCDLRNCRLDAVHLKDLILRSCTFDRIFLGQSTAYNVQFIDCTILNPTLQGTHEWEKYNFINSCLINDSKPISISKAREIRNSNLRGVTFLGRAPYETILANISDSVIYGTFSNVALRENRHCNQLFNSDLSRCEFENVRLAGIDTRRCALPANVRPAVIHDWHRVANFVFTEAMEIAGSAGSSNNQRVAAEKILQEVQLDAGTFHAANGSRRTCLRDLGLPASRGARYICEFQNSQMPPAVQEEIKSFYRSRIENLAFGAN